MVLHSNILGENNEKQILILHGLYGNLDSWKNVGDFLANNYCVHLLDLRNHGKSFHNNSHTYNDLINDIENYTLAYNISQFSIIGHSMGGKTAMFFAEKHPQKIDKMVIVDISPRSYKSLLENEPNTTFHLNVISLMKSLDVASYSTYSEISSQISTQNIYIKNLILKNLQKTKKGFIWKINIDAISNNLNNILDGLNADDYIDNKILVKSLFIKATNSDYITNNDKKLISFIFSNSEIIEINNASHWIHTEQPDILKNEIFKFLLKD